MKHVLHNITGISYIECRYLKDLTLVPGTGVRFNYWRNFQSLPLVGLATGEVSSKVEDKVTVYTTTVTARLAEHFDVAHRHLSYLLTTVDGSHYLVGCNERPFPISTTVDSLPGKMNDPSICTLTVEYADTLGLMPVID